MRDTLKGLAAEETKLREWLAINRESFCDAMGMWADDDSLIMMLVKIRDSMGGHFSMYKDDIDRARCDAIMPLLRGQKDIDLDEVRIGVALLAQSFNAAVDRIHVLESAQRRERQFRPPPRPPFTRTRY